MKKVNDVGLEFTAKANGTAVGPAIAISKVILKKPETRHFLFDSQFLQFAVARNI